MGDTRPLITFLSDYGHADELVGICHGVIAERCPQARVIDITHGIAPFDVRGGALALRSALRFIPAGVHLAVVDPGVGSDGRRAVALRISEAERLLVGPDNGLLMLAAAELGGVDEAADIGESRHRIEPVSATFHGRDIFAPVAAALAAGSPLSDVGAAFDPAELVVLELPAARIEGGTLVAHALVIDRFGNITLNAASGKLEEMGLEHGAQLTVEVAGRRLTGRYARTFADVAAGELLLYEDSRRDLALAKNLGSAAEVLGLWLDDELRLTVE